MVSNDQVMNEAAAQGQTMHASSGDTGGQSCAVAPTNGVPESGPPEVNYPCSSPYVVCVGGTSLFSNADGSYDTEVGWVAGGGGLSMFESSPYWQACVAPSNAGENAVRAVPDIGMDADENTGADVYVDGSPEAVGGTSLSSPLALARGRRSRPQPRTSSASPRRCSTTCIRPRAVRRACRCRRPVRWERQRLIRALRCTTCSWAATSPTRTRSGSTT